MAFTLPGRRVDGPLWDAVAGVVDEVVGGGVGSGEAVRRVSRLLRAHQRQNPG